MQHFKTAPRAVSQPAPEKERTKKPPTKKTAKKPAAKSAPAAGGGSLMRFMTAKPALAKEPQPQPEAVKSKREESTAEEAKTRQQGLVYFIYINE